MPSSKSSYSIQSLSRGLFPKRYRITTKITSSQNLGSSIPACPHNGPGPGLYLINGYAKAGGSIDCSLCLVPVLVRHWVAIVVIAAKTLEEVVECRHRFSYGVHRYGNTPLVILGLYMIMLLSFGVIASARQIVEEDFYLAGRGQGVLVTALTIVATMFSSAAVLGIPGLIYKMDCRSFSVNLPLSGAAVCVIGSRVWALGPKRGYMTPADLVSDYYSGSSLLAA